MRFQSAPPAIPRILRSALLAFAALLTGMISCAGAERLSVLILSPFSRDAEPFGSAVSSFRQTLSSDPRVSVDFYEVPLDLTQFPPGSGEDGLLAFLEDRVRQSSVDLVAPVGGVAARFAHHNRERLFKDIPMLAIGPEPRMLPEGFFDADTTMVTARVDVAGLVDDLLEILPETRRVAVVFGASPPRTGLGRDLPP